MNTISIYGGRFLMVTKDRLKESGKKQYYQGKEGFLIGTNSLNPKIKEHVENHIVYPVTGDVWKEVKTYHNHQDLMVDLTLLMAKYNSMETEESTATCRDFIMNPQETISTDGYFGTLFLIIDDAHIKSSAKKKYYTGVRGFHLTTSKYVAWNNKIISLNTEIRQHVENDIVYPVTGNVHKEVKTYHNHQELMVDLILMAKYNGFKTD